MSQSGRSRRDFMMELLEGIGERCERLLPRKAAMPGGSCREAAVALAAAGETLLGKLADFQVGRVLRLDAAGIEVVSLPSGIQARMMGDRRTVAMRMDYQGRVWANPSLTWEPDAVLNLMTGEKGTL
jgi:hypothetical protein